MICYASCEFKTSRFIILGFYVQSCMGITWVWSRMFGWVFNSLLLHVYPISTSYDEIYGLLMEKIYKISSCGLPDLQSAPYGIKMNS
jgi:hypothetical protein